MEYFVFFGEKQSTESVPTFRRALGFHVAVTCHYLSSHISTEVSSTQEVPDPPV